MARKTKPGAPRSGGLTEQAISRGMGIADAEIVEGLQSRQIGIDTEMYDLPVAEQGEDVDWDRGIRYVTRVGRGGKDYKEPRPITLSKREAIMYGWDYWNEWYTWTDAEGKEWRGSWITRGVKAECDRDYSNTADKMF